MVFRCGEIHENTYRWSFALKLTRMVCPRVWTLNEWILKNEWETSWFLLCARMNLWKCFWLSDTINSCYGGHTLTANSHKWRNFCNCCLLLNIMKTNLFTIFWGQYNQALSDRYHDNGWQKSLISFAEKKNAAVPELYRQVILRSSAVCKRLVTPLSW